MIWEIGSKIAEGIIIADHTVILQSEKVLIRNITNDDLAPLYRLIYEETEWKKWNAPYFPVEHESFEQFQARMMERLEKPKTPESQMIVQLNGEVIGTVNYYWEHKPSNWLETGIVIYKPEYWNGGYGSEALRLWIDYLFEELPLVRVGLTTWSGNARMMKVASKLGMKLEGQMRKCRLYNGVYYDSIRMGVLREEWESRG